MNNKLQNYLVIEPSKPFQLLPDLSLLEISDNGSLLVYLPENHFFVGVDNRMEAGFERRRKNVAGNTVNYISIEDWEEQYGLEARAAIKEVGGGE